MFIAFNPYNDSRGSVYHFPRASTTERLFCLLLKLQRHLQSKLWIVVPQLSCLFISLQHLFENKKRYFFFLVYHFCFARLGDTMMTWITAYHACFQTTCSAAKTHSEKEGRVQTCEGWNRQLNEFCVLSFSGFTDLGLIFLISTEIYVAKKILEHLNSL